jgi:prepilin-type N-terminal cleavage/methylation domain-containing protein
LEQERSARKLTGSPADHLETPRRTPAVTDVLPAIVNPSSPDPTFGRSRDEEGFTLIELLIVVLILGILAAIVAFAVGAFTSQSAVAACNTDAKSVESAVAAFQSTNAGASPQTTGALESSNSGGPYLHAFPKNTSYYTVKVSTAGTVYVSLSHNDPAFKSDGYTATGTYGTATGQAYDTFTWATGGTYKNIPKLNICAGA